MTQETVLEAAPDFRVGRVISVSFAVLGRNLVPFLVISFAISIPYILIQTWVDFADFHRAATQSGGTHYAGATSYVQAVTFSLVQAALTYGTLQDLRSRPAGLGECFQQGLQASGRVIGAALLYSFVQILALIALIVPAIIVSVIWWVYVPAIVVENQRIGASFKRSQVLTAGRRWQIFALIALSTVVGLGIVVAVAMIVPGLVGAVASTLLAVLFSAYFSVMTAVGYYFLRAEKEGVVIDDIASVFD